MGYVRRLFEHLRWADDRVLAGLEAATDDPTARPSAADIPGAGILGESLEMLAHILAAELLWLDRIEGAAQSVPVWPRGGLPRCRQLAARSRDRYEVFLSGLGPGDLERSIDYRNSAGHRFASTVEEILVHVALHGTYHRGQIALQLRSAGIEPSPTDYIAFARGAPAATRADSEPQQEEERA